MKYAHEEDKSARVSFPAKLSIIMAYLKSF